MIFCHSVWSCKFYIRRNIFIFQTLFLNPFIYSLHAPFYIWWLDMLFFDISFNQDSSEAAPLPFSLGRSANFHETLYSSRMVFRFLFIYSMAWEDIKIYITTLRVSWTSCTHIRGDKYLFNAALKFCGCRQRICSCFQTSFTYLNVSAWFCAKLAGCFRVLHHCRVPKIFLHYFENGIWLKNPL